MENKNNEKIILSLCGGSGAWEKPYKDNGYDVRLITLPDYDVRHYNPPDNVYGILAAPPCTMFSFARTRAKTPRDFKSGMVLVRACLEIIWKSRYKNKLQFWALENPMGYLRQFLGNPKYTFQPCWFGHGYTKKTDLWGYFSIPEKHPVKLNIDQLRRCKNNTRKLPSISDITGSKQSARRAITPTGFSKAFYEANK